MTQISPDADAAISALVVVMAVYKGIELVAAKFKVDQTMCRAVRDGLTADGSPLLGESPSPARRSVQLRVLAWLQIHYGALSMALVLAVFATLGTSMLAFESVRAGRDTSLVVAACTMLVSLYGAVINAIIEYVRLTLEQR